MSDGILRGSCFAGSGPDPHCCGAFRAGRTGRTRSPAAQRMCSASSPGALAFDISQGQGSVPSRGQRADHARTAVQPVPRAVHVPVDASVRPPVPAACAEHGRRRARDRGRRSDDGVLRERDDRPRAVDARAVLSRAADEAALCRDDCRGCVRCCGTNLNRETCDCNREWEDPRLAALKTLRLERRNESPDAGKRCRIQNDDTRRPARRNAARTTRSRRSASANARMPRAEAAAPRLRQLRLLPRTPGSRGRSRKTRIDTPPGSCMIWIAVDAMGGDHAPRARRGRGAGGRRVTSTSA